MTNTQDWRAFFEGGDDLHKFNEEIRYLAYKARMREELCIPEEHEFERDTHREDMKIKRQDGGCLKCGHILGAMND